MLNNLFRTLILGLGIAVTSVAFVYPTLAEHTVVADHDSACHEASALMPRDWMHMSMTPLESFSESAMGDHAYLLTAIEDKFRMPSGGRAYMQKARIASDMTLDADDGIHPQAGMLRFTIPAVAVLRDSTDPMPAPSQNVRMVGSDERGPRQEYSCHFTFSRRLPDCTTPYPSALVPPPFEITRCHSVE